MPGGNPGLFHIPGSLLKNGVTVSLAGRVGEVTKIDSDYTLKLKWQDDQSESHWIGISELDGEPLKEVGQKCKRA
jgi:hypothetical protein